MTGMGMHPPVPLDQARAAARDHVIETLRNEIDYLRGEVADLQARNDRLTVAWNEARSERADLAAKVANGGLNRSALTVVEPDDDELNASIARHPSGGAR